MISCRNKFLPSGVLAQPQAYVAPQPSTLLLYLQVIQKAIDQPDKELSEKDPRIHMPSNCGSEVDVDG